MVPDPGVELGDLALLTETFLDLGGGLLQGCLFFFLDVGNLDKVEPEVRLDGARELALLRLEGGVVELRDEASFRLAAQIPTRSLLPGSCEYSSASSPKSPPASS